MNIIFNLIVLLLITKASNGWPALAVSADSNEVVVNGSNGSTNKTCNSCHSLVNFIDKLYRNDTNLLNKGLTDLCNDYSALPGRQTSQSCQFMVQSVIDIFQKVNKQTFCDEISACAGHTGQRLNEVGVGVTDDPNCNFCVTVVTNVKDIVSGAPTELEVKYFVEDACHYLGSFENECVSLSDEYIDTLFAYIRSSLQPKQFCQSIGACKASSHVNPEPISEPIEKLPNIEEVVNIFPAQVDLTPLQSAKPVDRPSDDMECLVCKRVVEFVVQELEDNKTEEAIIGSLKHICGLFPQKERSKCESFVEQYANELIHILIEEGDPDLACTLLGVCVPKSVWQTISYPKNESHKKVIKWTEMESSVEEMSATSDNRSRTAVCYECQLLMHFLQNQIYDFNNEEQIEEFVEHQLCDRMQVVITKESCDQFVQTYGPQVLQIIAQNLFDPSNVCEKYLKLCPNVSQTDSSFQSSQIPEFEMNGPTAKCDICVSLVQTIDTLLENQEFDKEMTKVVEKSCRPLPKDRRVECELMVEAFFPYFLQKIGHLKDANEVCRSIDMCYTAGHVQLLGAHKCTYGPTYWCHTIAHAEACRAKEFCKNKVWKAMP